MSADAGGAPPAPQTPPVRVDPARVRPSRVWYWVGGVAGLAAIAVSIVLAIGLIDDVDSLTGELTRLETPGEASLVLDAGAERTIYQQVRGVSGRIDTPPNATVACTVGRGAERVDVDDTGGFTLTRGSEKYESLLKFEVDRPGRYTVTCQDPNRPERRIPLAIGRTVELLGFIGRILATLAAFFGGIGLGAGTATVVAIMRADHRRRLARQVQQSG